MFLAFISTYTNEFYVKLFSEGLTMTNYKVLFETLDDTIRQGFEVTNGKLFKSICLHEYLSTQHSTRKQLNVMKQRFAPLLDLNLISKQKILVIGCGTLGCNLIRTLVAWGVENFVVLDNGYVSDTNPIRQNLFTRDQIGRKKVDCIKESLTSMVNHLCVEKHHMTIPVPGSVQHLTYDCLLQQIETLNEIISKVDCVFLLTDSIESRWLPSILAKVNGKPLFNAALSYDALLINKQDETCGCYFCNMVSAPQHNPNIPFDQRCTATRPGLAAIASSQLVELYINFLHKPVGCIGDVPDGIRMFLNDFSFHQIEMEKVGYCVGCSQHIFDVFCNFKFEKEKQETIVNMFKNPQTIEKLSGLQKKIEEWEQNTCTFDSLNFTIENEDDDDDDLDSGEFILL
eukprot:TRINITY_DN1632_c0_g1_i1.p1 TRINITY_DN1632_c0_g1~~TRINITY_DN1632_c0_g1_i1.p1  ORF type:complete len:442 (-),score=107.93 TRINITY_DN1632_c0_g1_i1:302-1501(-)